MKQTRRKELKTNELSIYLQQIRETAVKNATYIVGGLVIVALILVIGLTVQRNRLKAEGERWREYREIQTAVARGETDALSRAANLAEQTAGNPRLGPRTLILYGDVLSEKAMTLSPLTQSEERVQLLESAKDQFQKVITNYSAQNETVLGARMKLASVAETLYIDGKGDLDLARKQYQEVLKAPHNPFRETAQTQLDTLTERTQKLQVVATRPAETAPAPVATPRGVPQFQPIPESIPNLPSATATAPTP